MLVVVGSIGLERLRSFVARSCGHHNHSVVLYYDYRRLLHLRSSVATTISDVKIQDKW